MQLRVASLLAAAAAAGLIALGHARSLSYRMRPGEQNACFYSHVDTSVELKKATLPLYFAV